MIIESLSIRSLIGVLGGVIAVAAATMAQSAALQDPTAPYSAAHNETASPRSPQLQGTFLAGGGERRAVISGRTYRVGDKFDGATVSEIRPYEVVLHTATGHERVLRMLPKLQRRAYFAPLQQREPQQAGGGDGPEAGQKP